MAKCPAITRSGEGCKGFVRPGDDYCVAHDPARTEQRSAAASKAGRAKSATAEFREVKAQLRKLADDVLAGHVRRADASVVAQVLGVWCKAAEAEVRTREFTEVTLPEFQEVVHRIEVIEQLQSVSGGNGYGA